MKHENDVILVVDDNLHNIKVVVDYLKESGFETAVARNGITGLKRAELLQPLLILLDVMMPEMDGYEVCRRLKSDEALKEIPVIFMTALDGLEDKLKAFAIGGVDYISKPARKEEVLARVTTHVKLRLQARELEEARETAEQANRAKSVFLANMSHELRSPLGTILGFSQLLHHDRHLTSEHMESLDAIQRSGEHLLRLIDRVLDLSKIEAGRLSLEPHDFALYPVLHDMQEMFRMHCEKKGLQFQLERGPDLPHGIHCDELKLRQILINLLSNAVKFTQHGGVTLRAAVKHSSDTPLRLAFEVEDSGVGIASDEMDRLFEAFSQTSSGRQSREGTGLGLAISQKFAHMMGGEIRVAGDVGRGSCFSFEIQCRFAEQKDEIPQAPDTQRVIGLETGQAHFRLLIVDNNDDNRRLLMKLLEPLGFCVREAGNGVEAVEVWREWEPDLIFMDIRMPIMGGLEATRRIREEEAGERQRHTSIIAVTAGSLPEERQAILEAGCDDVVYKPFPESDIFTTLQRYSGLRFVYESAEECDGSSLEDSEPIDIPLALSLCPPEFLDELRVHVETTDVTKVTALIESIQEQHTALAKVLKSLTNDFEYDALLTHLQQAEELQHP